MKKLIPRYWPIILPSTQLLTLFCRKINTVGNTGDKAKPLTLNVCRLYNFSFLIIQSENVWDLPSNSQSLIWMITVAEWTRYAKQNCTYFPYCLIHIHEFPVFDTVIPFRSTQLHLYLKVDFVDCLIFFRM